MMNEKLRVYNFVSNLVISALVVAAVFAMFFGSSGILQASHWSAFKYFTVDSNVLVGITSLISLFYLWKRNGKYPLWLMLFKMAATVSVGITFMTVILYLGPIYGYPMMFENANLYMHLIIPVLALITFAVLDPKEELKFRYNFLDLIPVIIYGIFYLINVAATNDYGNVYGNDWYAFGTFGLGIGFVCLMFIIILGFLISLALYFLYKKIKIKTIHA